MTKSEIIYQRVLQFKGLVNEINIKHYEQERFIEIVDAIFDDVFKDEEQDYRELMRECAEDAKDRNDWEAFQAWKENSPEQYNQWVKDGKPLTPNGTPLYNGGLDG